MNILNDDLLIVSSIDMSMVKLVEYDDGALIIDVTFDDQQKRRFLYETEFAYYKMKKYFVEYYGASNYDQRRNDD